MTDHQHRPAFAQHKQDAEMLRGRDARLGEAQVSGDRWWPHETWKYADLAAEGAHLTSYERWLADREAARRERRSDMPSVVGREAANFEPTRAPGVSVAYLVAPHLGLEAPSHTVELLRLEPGSRTERTRGTESVTHVLSGTGRSLIYEAYHDWGPHDSIHVPEGAWHQHINTGTEPVILIIGRPTPLMEHLYTMAIVYKGDSFSDLPDDFKPEHPFTKERVTVGYVDGMKWMSEMQRSHHMDRATLQAMSLEARKVMKAGDAVIQRSHHKGDWKVGLIDPFLGFSNRTLGMYVHQMPPSCHTETHKHGWATIYILSGHGYSIVDGDRHDWQAGDVLNVPAGAWHQHFNEDPDEVSQHLLISPDPLRKLIHLTEGSVETQADPDMPAAVPETVPKDWWA